MKISIKRIMGIWCLEYNCWPEDHPGCAKRAGIDCEGCPKSIFKKYIGKSDGIELPEEETIQ